MGEALPGEHGGGARDRVGQVRHAVGPQEVAGQRLRGLEQDAGGVAGVVADDHAAGGDDGPPVQHPGPRQDLGGHRADVGGAVLEPHRPPAPGAVERAPVRRAAERDVVVAAADDERVGRELGRPRGDRVVDGVEVAQPAERDLGERLPEPGRVLVGVVEPGHHRRAPGARDAARAHPGRELVVLQHGEDAAVVHGHGPPARAGVVEGQDVGVAQQQVDLQLVGHGTHPHARWWSRVRGRSTAWCSGTSRPSTRTGAGSPGISTSGVAVLNSMSAAPRPRLSVIAV